MNYVPIDDINYLAQQSSERINLILAGMTSLMRDTENKVTTMESQNWFQRMVKTITGKNKLTKAEIQKNHDKLNAYMSEAIAELYNRNCIDQSIILSLGAQINEIYADQVLLKQMLGGFVKKLNNKIESVDNFHMLATEIDQGVYSGFPSVVAICKVISQFDKSVLNDARKLDILKRCLASQGIIDDTEFPLIQCLQCMIDLSEKDVGQVYIELSAIKVNYLARILLEVIEQYHFLPEMAKKIKNPSTIIDRIITDEGLNCSVTLSTSNIFEDFLLSKVQTAQAPPIIEDNICPELVEVERLYSCKDLDAAFQLLQRLVVGNIMADPIQVKKWVKKLANENYRPAIELLYEVYTDLPDETYKEAVTGIKFHCTSFRLCHTFDGGHFNDEGRWEQKRVWELPDDPSATKGILGIPNSDEILLIYTSADYLCVITNSGIFYKEGRAEVIHTTFSEMSHATKIHKKGTTIYADNKPVSSFLEDGNTMDELLELFTDIADTIPRNYGHIRFEWSKERLKQLTQWCSPE